MKIKKILVPIDGSEQAFKAIDLAAELACNGNAEVVLLNVIGREQMPEAIRRFASVEHIDGPPEWQYEQLVAAGILKAGQQRARNKGIKTIDTRVRHGDSAKAIVEAASDKSIDMIVMGNRGLGKVKGLAFGSVSQKVSHLAPCSVITVT
jgi:nucleotide-binding universal stress UspA family protein